MATNSSINSNNNVNKEIKIFSLNRIKFQLLYEDALAYIKASYKAAGQKFNTASPFGQLLQVILHLGRMIFYYIEDSITGLNIKSAYRPDQIRGLARLAGHDSARTIAARGAIKITFHDTGNTEILGKVCYIPNKTTITNTLNGYTYTILFGAENAKITMLQGNFVEATVIQGTVKMQTATGTGYPLLSYNFAERNFAEVDQYYINVYVNSEPWDIVTSLQDLGYMQKGCIVKTGINSGIDVYFGNGKMGACPPEGSTIIVEYIVADGENPNITKENANSSDYWTFNNLGLLIDGSSMDLNSNFKITCLSDIIFGTNPEDTALTLLIAPHASKSFVLANETNYKYFFKRMNMFSTIQIIQGTYTVNGSSIMELAYSQAEATYENDADVYLNFRELYGDNDPQTIEVYNQMLDSLKIMSYAKLKLTDNTYRDNTIYIFLIPDITKRISATSNYFNCDESLFYLSEDEQANIINLIDASELRIITVENRILLPKTVRFAINAEVKIWENYDEEQVYASAVEAVSTYLLNLTRLDIIPLSDIIAVFENNVSGIDSVKVSFVADKKNEEIYGEGNYGIDSYGDIILSRTIVDATGQVQTVRDIIALIRGGFTGTDGNEYSATLTQEGNSALNLFISTTKSQNSTLNLTKYTALT